MQSSRELIKAMTQHTGFDRVGVYEGFWDDTLRVWVSQGYPTRTVVEDGVEKTVPADPFHFFQYDLHRCGGFFDTEPILGMEVIEEETDEWVIKRNGAGAALKWWKHKSGTPEHVDFRIQNRQIWEQEYRPYLLQVDHNRFNGKWWEIRTLEEDRQELRLARERGQWAWYGQVLFWEIMRQTLGDLCMYESMLLDPGWIMDFNRVYTDFLKAHFEVLFAENGLPDGIWLYDDIAYKNGLFASPKVMNKLFLPFYREMVDYFKGYGLPVWFHSDGNITSALPMLLEAGFSGLHPMEVKAGCDLLSLARTYGDKLIFIGGLDVRILETNDRVVIEREVRRLLESMKEIGAAYVFGSDHTVTPLVSYDSYRYALDVYREHCMF